jgi:predicted transcriptional regulator
MDIWASILDHLISQDASASRIVSSANLNRGAAKERLKELIDEELIRTKQSRIVVYSITEEGVKWLKRYKSLRGKHSEKTYNTGADFP